MVSNEQDPSQQPAFVEASLQGPLSEQPPGQEPQAVLRGVPTEESYKAVPYPGIIQLTPEGCASRRT